MTTTAGSRLPVAARSVRLIATDLDGTLLGGDDQARYRLYASLRALDAVGADFILIEALPGGPGWRAVADRLGRAAVGSGGAEA